MVRHCNKQKVANAYNEKIQATTKRTTTKSHAVPKETRNIIKRQETRERYIIKKNKNKKTGGKNKNRWTLL